MKYVKERINLPSENNDIYEEYGLYLILFFVTFSVIMVGLYIYSLLVICCEFYKYHKSPQEESSEILHVWYYISLFLYYKKVQSKFYICQSLQMSFL